MLHGVKMDSLDFMVNYNVLRKEFRTRSSWKENFLHYSIVFPPLMKWGKVRYFYRCNK